MEKALEKDPAERYQSMQDLVVDLRRVGRPSVAPPPAQRNTNRWILTVTAAAVLVIAAGVTSKIWPHAAAPQIRSIAVLPLENFSGDPTQEYFSDGTTEALISKLAQIHSLSVISRTSAMRYKRTTKSLPEIGRELGADAVIEASVYRSGNRVRITAQLIRAATDTHLWAHDYERDAVDLLRLESDVAQAIAVEIRAQVTPAESARIAQAQSINPEAQDEYLLGMYENWKFAVLDLKQAVGHFERAIQSVQLHRNPQLDRPNSRRRHFSRTTRTPTRACLWPGNNLPFSASNGLQHTPPHGPQRPGRSISVPISPRLMRFGPASMFWIEIGRMPTGKPAAPWN